MTELLGWFDAAGFDYTASMPTIGDRGTRRRYAIVRFTLDGY